MRSKLESLLVLVTLGGMSTMIVALGLSFFMAYAAWIKFLAYGGMLAIAAGCVGLLAAQLISDVPREKAAAKSPEPDGAAGNETPAAEETAGTGAPGALAVAAAAGAGLAGAESLEAQTSTAPSEADFGLGDNPFGDALEEL